MPWLRKLRAVSVIALTWGLIWLPMGVAVGVMENHRGADFIPSPTWFSMAFALWGAVSGALFAFLLMLSETGRKLAELPLIRVAIWGGLGCLSLPLVITGIDLASGPWTFSTYDWLPVLVALAVSAALGAMCAAGTVALVRRPST